MRDDASSSLPSRTGCRRFTLPVEQSTRFALVINLKAAKELGIDMPERARVWVERDDAGAPCDIVAKLLKGLRRLVGGVQCPRRRASVWHALARACPAGKRAACFRSLGLRALSVRCIC